MALHSNNIAGQVEKSLGDHQAWMNRCSRRERILAAGESVGTDQIMECCQSMACFDGQTQARQPLPQEQIKRWCEAVDDCQTAWEAMSERNPIICDLWKMGQQGFDDCCSGLRLLSEQGSISHRREPELFQALKDYSAGPVFHGSQLAHPGGAGGLDDIRFTLRQQLDRILQPFGLQALNGEGQSLRLEDREALQDALARAESLQDEWQSNPSLQSGFAHKLEELHEAMTKHMEELESSHTELQSYITKAWNNYQADLQKLNQDLHRRRRSRVKQQAAEELGQEAGQTAAVTS